MHGGDCLQRCLEALFAQQLAECIQNDAIADAEEQVERSRHDALGRNSEERRVCAIEGVSVCRSAITSGVEKVLV
jgi:hypothetical protein